MAESYCVLIRDETESPNGIWNVITLISTSVKWSSPVNDKINVLQSCACQAKKVVAVGIFLFFFCGQLHMKLLGQKSYFR